MFKYKPGIVQAILKVDREVFRYWRRTLDPIPTRPQFTYQMILAYVVLKKLIDEYWIEPHKLKTLNIKSFFEWFSATHGTETIRSTTVELNREYKLLSFYDKKEKRNLSNENRKLISIDLCEIDDYVTTVLKNSE